jgi:hypothetical protein
MFFYKLDFHDLAPNSFLLISTFIIICEAFLRVRPHFGLWLKIFNIKPKIVDSQQADCGGVMVNKLPQVEWPEGTFIETVKIWQKEWFYITEPRSADWGVIPAFRSRLVSWTKKGLDWGSNKEVALLQSQIAKMIEQGVKLPNVIQIMLSRRILPFQDRASPMWAYKPEDPATVLSFYRTSHAQLWRVLFKPQKDWLAEEEDIGLDTANPPREV